MYGVAIALASLWVSAEPTSTALDRAVAYDAELRADVGKQRYRHNLERLIRLWRAAGAAEAPELRRRALEGELEAQRLLARWSGAGADRAQVDRLKARLDGLRPTPRAEAARAEARPKRDAPAEPPKAAPPSPAWIASLPIAIEGEGFEIALPSGVLEAKRQTIAGDGERAPRLVFDLSPAVAAKAALEPQPVEHAGVARLRVGQLDADTVRLVLDLDAGAAMPAVAELDAGALRLVIRPHARPSVAAAPGPSPAPPPEVDGADPLEALIAERLAQASGAPASAPAAVAEASPVPAVQDPSVDFDRWLGELEARAKARAPSAPDPAPPAPPAEAEAPPDEPRLHQRTTAALKAERRGLLEVRRVVIDAGHGGKDQGAHGRKKTKEKDVNLAIALALGRELERRGIEVVYTRKDDRFLSLRRRAEIALRARADLFVSVHANAHKDKSMHGIETFVLNTTSSAYAQRLARRENGQVVDESTISELDPREGKEEPEGALPEGELGSDLRLLLADLAMRSASEDSRRLGGLVQSSMISEVAAVAPDVRDLGVKRALFYVLLGVRMPSILIETGFLTNAAEEGRLASPTYQNRLAAAIAAGIHRFILERDRIAQQM